MLKIFRFAFLICLFLHPGFLSAQSGNLKITSPKQDNSSTNTSTMYFRGTAHPNGLLSLDDDTIKIYSTGVFAAQLQLKEGKNQFKVHYQYGDQNIQRDLVIQFNPPPKPQPTSGFAIEYARILPEGEIWLQEGDILQVEMKASPGMKATFYHQIPMVESPVSMAGVAGIYRGEYQITKEDVAKPQKINFSLIDPSTNKVINRTSDQHVTFMAKQPTLIALTNKQGAELSYGLGADRLGGAKIGALDSLVRLQITGKTQRMYRVKLSDQMQAYIHEQDVRLLDGIHFTPGSLTGSWSVYSDGKYDYVNIGLSQRLPYTVKMEENPTRLVVDIYGAVSNSNWITQKAGLNAIKNVWYEQVSKDIFRAFIELDDKDGHWGHQVSYHNNNLVIRVKPRPKKLNIGQMTIALDAGHGGSNSGAVGMTGVLEKELNLIIARKIQELLEKKGSTVIMTRSMDRHITNGQRVRNLQEIDPDLLISIHCNASVNPMVKGTSTYYRHQAFRPLSQAIYQEMLELGLADFGNVGGFNFVLNAPTEFPSALIEVAFMSNPEDEERLLNPDFYDDLANSIVRGIEKFLNNKQ